MESKEIPHVSMESKKLHASAWTATSYVYIVMFY
jgi:hypothetical protein